MKKSQFTEEKIAYALHEVESGTAVVEICRKLGASEQTFSRWKSGLRAWALLNYAASSNCRKRIAS